MYISSIYKKWDLNFLINLDYWDRNPSFVLRTQYFIFKHDNEQIKKQTEQCFFGVSLYVLFSDIGMILFSGRYFTFFYWNNAIHLFSATTIFNNSFTSQTLIMWLDIYITMGTRTIWTWKICVHKLLFNFINSHRIFCIHICQSMFSTFS